MQLLSENNSPKVLDKVKKLCGLHIEKIKLQLTEKLTLILSKILLAAIIFVMIVTAMVFITIACAEWLKGITSPIAAYCIVAAFYLLVAVVVFAFRRKWIIDPIARFLSRIILDAPGQQNSSMATDILSSITNSNQNV